MITATTFLRSKGIITLDQTDINLEIPKDGDIKYSAGGQIISFVSLLDEYHRVKMEEAGFKKDDQSRNDTVRT